MKKIVLTSASILALAGSVFAQGTVNWSSINPNAMTAVTDSTTYSTLVGPLAGQAVVGGSVAATSLTAGSYYYQLLYSVGASQVAAPTTLAGLQAFENPGVAETAGNNTSGTAGRLTPANSQVQAATPADWSPGTSATIILVGWSANLGTTYAAALSALQNWSPATAIANAYFGISSSGYITPNAPGANGATLFGTGVNANGTPINSPNTHLYELSPVPEPATMVLAGLGGLSLLALRRKK